MCDAKSVEATLVGRRQFGALAAGATAAALWPMAAVAQASLASRDVRLETAVGIVDAYFTAPSEGKHPAVLIWPDIRTLRPAFRLMADRLAAEGYAVLCVNPFYRWNEGPALKEGESFSDEAARARLFGWMRQMTRELVEADSQAYFTWLDAQDAVDSGKKAAVTGYCMGGPMAVHSAAALPDRIAAVASFHGGGVGSDQPDSPHLAIGGTQAAYLFAIAEDDDAKDPQEKERLKAVLAPRPQWHEVEVYPAKHGWCPPDGMAYDEAQAEKAWGRMLVMLKAAI